MPTEHSEMHSMEIDTLNMLDFLEVTKSAEVHSTLMKAHMLRSNVVKDHNKYANEMTQSLILGVVGIDNEDVGRPFKAKRGVT